MGENCCHHDNGKGKVGLRESAFVTLHCLTGCSIGELLGLVLGSIFALSVANTIGLAVILAFFFGISLAVLPLIYGRKMTFMEALKTVWIGEVVSITVMEIAMNGADLWFGGIGQPLTSSNFWLGFLIALIAGYIAAWPVNHYLVKRNLKACH